MVRKQRRPVRNSGHNIWWTLGSSPAGWRQSSTRYCFVIRVSVNLGTNRKHLLLTGQQLIMMIKFVFDYCLATNLLSFPNCVFSFTKLSNILGSYEGPLFRHVHRIRKFCPVISKIIPICILLLRSFGWFCCCEDVVRI